MTPVDDEANYGEERQEERDWEPLRARTVVTCSRELVTADDNSTTYIKETVQVITSDCEHPARDAPCDRQPQGPGCPKPDDPKHRLLETTGFACCALMCAAMLGEKVSPAYPKAGGITVLLATWAFLELARRWAK